MMIYVVYGALLEAERVPRLSEPLQPVVRLCDGDVRDDGGIAQGAGVPVPLSEIGAYVEARGARQADTVGRVVRLRLGIGLFSANRYISVFIKPNPIYIGIHKSETDKSDTI